MRILFFVISVCFLSIQIAQAQDDTTSHIPPDKLGEAFPLKSGKIPPAKTEASSPKLVSANNGLYFKFNESGTQYLKMNIWLQSWVRAIENNPGTAVNGQPQNWSSDAGIRRMRIQLYGQTSKRFLLMMQVGMNNQSFATGGGTGTGANGAGKKAPFFIHDAYSQFTIFDESAKSSSAAGNNSLYIGTGLHSWNGVSRLTNASTISLLTADAPVFNWPTVEVSDQFTRQFGVFAKGNIDRLNYRVSINKPFMTSGKPTIGGPAVDNNRGNSMSYNGYFDYQFLDGEETPNAFFAGSYYGKKKVFNVGAGFLHAPKGTMTQPSKNVYLSHAITTLGADIFFDTPVGSSSKEMSFTLYSVWYNYNFGPDYLRTTGVMNPGTADTSYTGLKALEGFGNSRILMGTGNIWYTQTAFTLPKFSDKLRIQPYIAYSYKNLKALNQPGNYYNAGANFLFDGNHVKLSLEYGSRPLYTTTDRKIFKRAGEFLASIQFWL
ncbi:porin [Pedobacter sp. PAMC26386]|nr:porin [Pedobacter sp. PAMC26386]